MEMTKKLKNKKGFTLIELIVVIAILAILALIAIPRFAGFTDKGKLAADNQYAAIVANSVVVLMTDGTITTHATADPNAGGTILIANDGTVTSGTGAAVFTMKTGLTFTSEVEKLVAKKKLQDADRTYSIVIPDDGVVPTIVPTN